HLIGERQHTLAAFRVLDAAKDSEPNHLVHRPMLALCLRPKAVHLLIAESNVQRGHTEIVPFAAPSRDRWSDAFHLVPVRVVHGDYARDSHRRCPAAPSEGQARSISTCASSPTCSPAASSSLRLTLRASPPPPAGIVFELNSAPFIVPRTR